MANKENEPPQKKKRRLSLSQKKSNDEVEKNIGSWWNFIREEEQSSLATNFVPKNTASSTKWALSNFMEWKASLNETFCEDTEKQVPDDILETSSPEVICMWFGLYVDETQKLDGSCYSPETIYLLLNEHELFFCLSFCYYQSCLTTVQ